MRIGAPAVVDVDALIAWILAARDMDLSARAVSTANSVEAASMVSLKGILAQY